MGLSSGAAAGLDATLLLRHIKIVQQSRELVSAIRSHATLENIEDAENALDSSLGGEQRVSHGWVILFCLIPPLVNQACFEVTTFLHLSVSAWVAYGDYNLFLRTQDQRGFCKLR